MTSFPGEQPRPAEGPPTAPPPTSAASKIMGVVAGALAVGMVVWTAVQILRRVFPESDAGLDDANITFVYARNIAAGHGFVFNVGGERVEGSTSPLWTLICAGIFRLGGGDAEVRLASIACFCLTHAIAAAVVAALAARDGDGARKTADAPLSGVRGGLLLYFALVFSSPAYLTWNCLTLMDAVLWGASVSAASWFLARPPKSPTAFVVAVAVWATMSVVRPDALLVGPAFAALAGWCAAGESRRRGIVVFGTLGLASFLSLGAATLFRLVYFGYPLPNTYYAKISQSWHRNLADGLKYDQTWATSSPVIAAVVLMAGSLAWHALRPYLGRKTKPAEEEGSEACDPGLRPQQTLAMAFWVLCAVPLATGGDHFHQHRFLLPAYQLGCLLLADWARRGDLLARGAALLGSAGAAAPSALVAAAVVVAPSYLHEHNWWSYRSVRPLQLDFTNAVEGRKRGAQFAALFKPAAASEGKSSMPTLGLLAAGGTGLAYPGDKFDLFGLNTVAMAHSPADRSRVKNHSAFHPDVFFQTPPDVLDCSTPDDEFTDFITHGVIRSEKFRALYTFGSLRRADAPTESVPMFIRRDYLQKLLSGPASNGLGVAFEFEPFLGWDSKP